ncbi:hypothetical protein CVT24_008019 [Panaeolus cyanescens]|uniref:NmrA-like domain-containing protein n=1 Tax=Panaeolus cyanescens TaxID=181874 RepID=A0A409YQX5_9AGAR|nr:hypothetical protein CVT24_008019 [Panaeolus cyanescens]
MSTKILITGGTGYLGSGVLSRLLDHSDASSFEITALVRSSDKASKLQSLGVKTIVGSYNADNLAFLKEAAANADIVIAMADSDTLPPALAILEGQKKRFAETGIKPVLIHTSGSAIVMDDARGMHPDHVTYSDLEAEKLNALPDTALHRNVDKALVEADEEGYPALVRKRGGFIGKGLNTWPAVEVNEVIDLFMILFNTICTHPDKAGHGKNGYYFAENFHYSYLEMANAISSALVDLGVGSDGEANAFSEEELASFYGAMWPFLATNCYIKADRSRQLGWNPVIGKDAFLLDNMPTKIFITGATGEMGCKWAFSATKQVLGYVGSTVLSRLLDHPDSQNFAITALVRTLPAAEKLESLGVKTLIGSYHDTDLSFLTEAAANADIVITMVDSDLLPPVLAILSGIKRRYETTGIKPILFHTVSRISDDASTTLVDNGSPLTLDDAQGLHSDHITYSDLEVEKLNALPATTFHLNVDKPIMEADAEGYVLSYLVTPSTIFGVPKGKVVDLGISNKHSVQVPLFAKLAIARKRGGYIGKGVNVWPAVEVNDLADLYILLLDTVLSDSSKAGHGKEGYYFAECLHYSYLEMANTISEALVELGIGEHREANALSEEEVQKHIGGFWRLLAGNSYVKAERARLLGWKPRAGKEEFLADIKTEVTHFAQLAG